MEIKELKSGQIEAWRKEVLTDLKKKDKELKQLESKLQEQRKHLDSFKAA